MSLALYRKYRPQTFREVSGQTHIKTTLQNELEMDRVSHAYLFSGPRGTGKTTMARLLAKSVNCLSRKKGESEPCSKCEACAEITDGRSLDVIEIDAASHTGVDNVRENIIQSSKFTPTQRKYKVFIIDEVHMLSISAFNALLKTLEEPPKHAMFILATTELHKVPETILSRCQRFIFRIVAYEEIIKRLDYIIAKEEKKVDAEVVEIIARRSGGYVRDAESLLGQALSLGDKKITLDLAKLVIPFSDFQLVLEFIAMLQQKNTVGAVTFINNILGEGVDLTRFIIEAIEGLRKILLLTLGASLDAYAMNVRKEDELKLLGLSKSFSTDEIISIIETLLEYKEKIPLSPIEQLPIEIAILEICGQNSAKGARSKNNFLSDKAETFKKYDPKTHPLAQEDLSRQGGENNKGSKRSPTMEAVTQHWNQILEQIKKYNHTLFSFIRLNKPKSVKNNVIELVVNYSFHKERVEEMKNKLAIENILQEILGEKMKIECILIERKEDESGVLKEDKEIEAIAQEFGGSVIE